MKKVNNKNIMIFSYGLKFSVAGFPCYLTIVAITNIIYCLMKYGYVDTNSLYYPARYVYVKTLFPHIQNILRRYIYLLAYHGIKKQYLGGVEW